MSYTWDPRKNRRNLKLHGITFEDAVRVFGGPTLERADDRYEYGELRVYAIGLVNGIEITVILHRCVPDGTSNYLGMEGRAA
jgi:uncharacterized DUF497 family protein